MSEEIRNDERLKVTSVGNSWIVCKSKSHPGHVYYFNTLTGEAAWNLSDAEIEKAKHRTKLLDPGAKPTKCPEPKDKPPQSLPSDQFVRISEQQSSVMTYTNVPNNNATFGNPFNQITGVVQDTQIRNPSILEPISNFNTLNTYHLNTAQTVYNPKVWAVPYTQQVLIGPAAASTVNHSLGPLNVAFNHLSPSVSQPTTALFFNSFENGNHSDIMLTRTRTFYPRDFIHDQGVKKPISKKTVFTNKNDLRQKLSFKKRFNKNPGEPGLVKANSRNTNLATHIANKFDGIHTNDLNTGLENRCVESQLHETSSKIDVGPLKSLAPSESNADAWFIVADLEVLLNEFKFLTTLTDSDEKCHLMVPKRVMEELKNYVTASESIQAKRILRFLSQQIEVGYAFMAEEPSELEGDSISEVIHKTCKKLLDNKYHLVLLTNDNELLTECSSNINIFRIEEIKNFLKENPNKQLASSDRGPKKPFMTDELINKIKITVPNDAPQKISTISPVSDTKSDDIDNISKTPFKQKNNADKTEELNKLKHTVDAGIQTDLGDVNACISITNVVEKQRVNADSNILLQNTKETVTGHAVPLVPNILDKKREIKLKRSLSHQPHINSVESEKKQFKWRRRRKTSVHCQVTEEIPSHNDQNMNTKNVQSLETNMLSNEISTLKLPDKILNNNPKLGSVENKIADDSIESRESSIYAEPRNSTAKENITIEETSTSGIISNTESNVDADSNYSNSTNSIKQQLAYKGQPDKPMYEVENILMEQYLTMKCDEWISRFIQIMEEVLSQVLLQDPPFVHDAMPPPWTLHEAAQCITIKFRSHQSIIVAANKLSNILFQVSDAKGKIAMNMKPYQYMQMYTYGVHLLVAMKEVATSREDIEIAVDSLNKLLHDIKNPNVDSSTTETFNDNKFDNMSNNDMSEARISDVVDNTDDSSLHVQEMLPDRDQTEKVEKMKENPQKRKLSEEKEELQRPIKFIPNFDIPFPIPKSWSLQKSHTEINTVRWPGKSHVGPLFTHSRVKEQSNQKNVNGITEKEADSDVPNKQQNYIRKFNLCPKLEKKMEINYNSNNYEDEDLDYEESYGENVLEDIHYSEDESYDEQYNDATENQTDEGANTKEGYEPQSLKDANSLLRDENSKKFKYVMHELLQEIKSALSQVQILCDEFYKKLENPDQSTELKSQIRKIAERAHLHTIRLCRSLESMLDHKTNNPTQCMSALLEQADINIHHVDARLLFEYRVTIENCKNCADEFLESIRNVISKIKRNI